MTKNLQKLLIMKRIIFTIVLLTLSFATPTLCEAEYISVGEYSQQSQWEKIGKVTAFANVQMEFTLYAKVMGNSIIYRVERDSVYYVVSLGSHSINGKSYNASFYAYTRTWYLNV